MPAFKPPIAPGVISPIWGDEYSTVYDITDLDISCSEFISKDRPRDKYDYLGRNITAQERRQVLVPWVTPDANAKRYNRERPANTYDKFEINRFVLDYVWSETSHVSWSDCYKIYSTMSSF
jgi:hypothetical protein